MLLGPVEYVLTILGGNPSTPCRPAHGHRRGLGVDVGRRGTPRVRTPVR